MRKFFPFLIFLSAALEIFSEYFNRPLVYIFKPLTMILIIWTVWFYREKEKFYRRLILAGLVFSLAGDVFLIDSQSYFIFGLASFLIAHLCYTAAFFKISKGKFHALSLAAYLIGFGIFRLIAGGVSENLKVPVFLYTLAISTMLGAALNFWLTKKTPKAILALSGAFLFVVSDAALAYNRFSGEFFLAKLIVLATYFSAQFLIARSVRAD